jgi:hypothetical protein
MFGAPSREKLSGSLFNRKYPCRCSVTAFDEKWRSNQSDLRSSNLLEVPQIRQKWLSSTEEYPVNIHSKWGIGCKILYVLFDEKFPRLWADRWVSLVVIFSTKALVPICPHDHADAFFNLLLFHLSQRDQLVRTAGRKVEDLRFTVPEGEIIGINVVHPLKDMTWRIDVRSRVSANRQPMYYTPAVAIISRLGPLRCRVPWKIDWNEICYRMRQVNDSQLTALPECSR